MTNEVETESTSAQETQATAAPVAVPNKQTATLQAVLNGIAARDLGENHPTFREVTDGKKITLIPNEANLVAWPEIVIGPSGGIDLPQVRSWDSTLAPLTVAINGDAFLKVQMERDAKREAAAKAEQEKTAKKTAEAEAAEGQPETAETAA